VLIPPSLAYTAEISEKKILSPLSEVSTRMTEVNIPILVSNTFTKFGSGCPPEIAIYIHGFNKSTTDAREEFDRLQTSLIYNNYRIPLVGFNWDSKTDWDTAKNNARENGLYLAQFIIGLKNKCPNSDIHIIAHSLGSSVVGSALVILDASSSWKGKIESTYLLGASINNQLIGNNTLLGNATEHVVNKFYNYYDPQDEGLKINRVAENHQPLGLVGAPPKTFHPNYNDINVVYEIPPIFDADGDGNAKECFEDVKPSRIWGNNHCGYIGFRNSVTGAISDDGAIDVIVRELSKK
jgi:esterase/lipase superfamily enzyme